MQIPLDIQPEMADAGAEHQVGLLQQFRPVLLGIQPLKLVADSVHRVVVIEGDFVGVLHTLLDALGLQAELQIALTQVSGKATPSRT